MGAGTGLYNLILEEEKKKYTNTYVYIISIRTYQCPLREPEKQKQSANYKPGHTIQVLSDRVSYYSIKNIYYRAYTK